MFTAGLLFRPTCTIAFILVALFAVEVSLTRQKHLELVRLID
jgi:hypothetical protein